MHHPKTLDTPLGQIQFFAHAEPTAAGLYEINVRVVEPEPKLPPGMSVRRVRAVVLQARSRTGFELLDYRCRLITDIEGSPDSIALIQALSCSR